MTPVRIITPDSLNVLFFNLPQRRFFDLSKHEETAAVEYNILSLFEEPV
jgi:hypothetical protein